MRLFQLLFYAQQLFSLWMMVDAINGNDFSTLRAMVYIGALLFIAAQIATDIAYTLVDPRVRLE